MTNENTNTNETENTEEKGVIVSPNPANMPANAEPKTLRNFGDLVRIDLLDKDAETRMIEGKKIASRTMQGMLDSESGAWNLVMLATKAYTDAQEETKDGDKNTISAHLLTLMNCQDVLDTLGVEKITAEMLTNSAIPGIRSIYDASRIIQRALEMNALADAEFWKKYAKNSRYAALTALDVLVERMRAHNKAHKTAKSDFEKRSLSAILDALIIAFTSFTNAKKNADEIATKTGFLPEMKTEGDKAQEGAEKAQEGAEKAQEGNKDTPTTRTENLPVGTRLADEKSALHSALKYATPPIPEQETEVLTDAILQSFREFQGQSVTAFDLLKTACRIADKHAPRQLSEEGAKTNAERIIAEALNVKADAEKIAEEIITNAEKKAEEMTAKIEEKIKRAANKVKKAQK